ncbi:MAG TPA: DUF302 domain-containing protein [Terriglobales bacterium]|nr:DUF302 domain-containing protein [Terriglobales bacterium]
MILYQVVSSKTIPQIAREFEAIAQKHKFGVLAVHDLKAKLNEKGVDFDRDCLIYEVCNPQQAKTVLEANPEISTALPCRIAIYPKGEGVILATIRPTALIGMFQTPGLKAVAEEVEAILVSIMNEAAR